MSVKLAHRMRVSSFLIRTSWVWISVLTALPTASNAQSAAENDACRRLRSAERFGKPIPLYARCEVSRSGDLAQAYFQTEKGTLYRFTDRRCRIAWRVDDFKTATAGDRAGVYFRYKGNLWELDPSSAAEGGCASARPRYLLKNVGWGEYQVLNADSEASQAAAKLIARSQDGRLLIWSGEKGPAHPPLVYLEGVTAYRVNPCFGEADRRLSEYVAFALKGGEILAFRATGEATSFNDRAYRDFASFIRSQKLCARD